MEGFRWRLKMTNIVVKDSEGTRGGLALFWKKEVNLRVLSWSRYHIDTMIKEEDGSAWRFTGIYGESVVRRRKHGNYYIFYSIAIIFCGCAMVILMRSFLIVKRKEVPLERKVAC